VWVKRDIHACKASILQRAMLVYSNRAMTSVKELLCINKTNVFTLAFRAVVKSYPYMWPAVYHLPGRAGSIVLYIYHKRLVEDHVTVYDTADY